MHSKWLDGRTATVARLAGLPGLGLAPPHPCRFHFTYLDPAHQACGHRRHDSFTEGDLMTPAYPPDVIVVAENKLTALHFPPHPRSICIEGGGKAVTAVQLAPWVRNCPRVVYWGDMDAAGLEILSILRGTGIAAASILMDIPAYDEWKQYGTNFDKHGKKIPPGGRKDLPYLTSAERALYRRLTDPGWTGHRRVEQEKIPLPCGRAALLDSLRDSPPATP